MTWELITTIIIITIAMTTPWRANGPLPNSP